MEQIHHHHHHHHDVAIKELGYLLTRSGLTSPKVSSKVFSKLSTSVLED
jgi:hypothetical protein